MWSLRLDFSVSALLLLILSLLSTSRGAPLTHDPLANHHNLISLVDASLLPVGTDLAQTQLEFQQLVQDLEIKISRINKANPVAVAKTMLQWNEDEMEPWLIRSQIDCTELLDRIQTRILSGLWQHDFKQ
jgi:hypothetical protein